MKKELMQHCQLRINECQSEMDMNRKQYESEPDSLIKRTLNAQHIFLSIEKNMFHSIQEGISKIGHF